MKNEAELGTALGVAALRGIARLNMRLLKNGSISREDFNRARRGAQNDLIDVQRRFPEATTPAHWDELRAELANTWMLDPSGNYPPED